MRANKLQSSEYLPEFTKAAIVRLVGNPNYFNREAVIEQIRNMKRNAGEYFGRVVFDAASSLDQRVDALEIRQYFDRSNEWERRRIRAYPVVTHTHYM